MKWQLRVSELLSMAIFNQRIPASAAAMWLICRRRGLDLQDGQLRGRTMHKKVIDSTIVLWTAFSVSPLTPPPLPPPTVG